MAHTHTQCVGLCRCSHQPFQLVQPIQMCSHTQPLIFYRKGAGQLPLPPPLPPRQDCFYLRFPLTHSRHLSHSLCFSQRMPVLMLMAVTGCASAPPPRPLHSRQWCVITVQRRAEWSDWWGDCGLLTEVLVRPQDVCSHWHSGTGDWPHWAAGR